MEDFFMVSRIIPNGIIGGGITAYSDYLEYKSGKLTVSAELREARIYYRDIIGANFSSAVFPTVEIVISSGDSYKFMMFNTKRFIKLLNKKGVSINI